MRGKFYIAILSFLLPASLFAQSVVNGKISGRIELENKQAAKYATLSLLRSVDSVSIKLAVPDEEGNFEFENLPAGNYLVSVSYTGYQKYTSSVIVITEGNAIAKLSPFVLKQNSSSLSEVTVQSKKPFIERKADRLIVNVENSITSAGATALEVLEKSPGVLVNQESGLNLKGKSGVTVMIDGKITPLAGTDLLTYLKSIPAANIERIDIITNPSAKYDASGNAGIIDIRFKKDKRMGYNGSLGFTYGQGKYSKTSANTGMNYRNKKWNLFGNYAINSPTNATKFFITRKFFNNGNVESVFDQNTFTKQPQWSNNLKLGADLYANKKDVVGVLLNGTFYQGKRDGLSNSVIKDAAGALQYTNQTSNLLKDKRYNVFGNLNYKHQFDSTGQELSADIDLGKINAKPLQHIFSQSFDINGVPTSNKEQKSDQQSIITVRSFKSDYVKPLKANARLEAGVKASFVTTDNDVKFFDIVGGNNVLDQNRSNHFIYKENVNAAYLNFSKEFKKNSIQVGLRMENTNTTATQVTNNQVNKRSYVQLFPSFAATQKINDNNEVSVSYSRRIDRATYRQLNPFKILVDSYTFVLGDPNLKPSLTDSYQFGYTFKGKYSATLSYIKSKDVITDVFEQDDVTKISSQIPANMQTFNQYDLGVNIPFSIKKWMNSNINASVYYNKYSSKLQGGELNNNSTSWDISMTNSFVIGKKGWSAELNSFYQSKQAWGQFIIRNLAQVSPGIQKISPNKKSVFKLSAADILSTNHIAVIVKYLNQDWHTDRTWDSRYITFSYTYRFGKNTVAKARQRTSGVEDEKKRAN